MGSDFSTNFDLWGATISPEARVGYRYDMVNTPVKLKGGFVSTGGIQVPGNTITFIGPDPDTGNAVAGLSLGACSDIDNMFGGGDEAEMAEPPPSAAPPDAGAPPTAGPAAPLPVAAGR